MTKEEIRNALVLSSLCEHEVGHRVSSIDEAMDMYAQSLTKELQDKVKQLEGENERLKGLVRKAHDTGLVSGFVDFAKGKLLQAETHWQQFKTDNSLT